MLDLDKSVLDMDGIRSLAILLLAALALPCHAEDWTTADTWKQAAFTTLLAIDCAQTRYEISHPGRTREGNTMIGPYPSKGKINNICFATGLGHFGISYVLPRKIRNDWQWATIAIEVAVIRDNYRISARMEF